MHKFTKLHCVNFFGLCTGYQSIVVKVSRHAELIAAWSFFGQSSTSWNACQSMQFFAHHGLRQAYKTCMLDEAHDGQNVALIDKCFMVCLIVQRRIKLLPVYCNLFVRDMTRTHSFRVLGELTVGDFKKVIASSTGVCRAEQGLMYGNI